MIQNFVEAAALTSRTGAFRQEKMEGESSTSTYDELESIILNGSSGPCSLPLQYLRRITSNFCDERLLGEGGFGKVYKGVLQNGKMVAVKRLDQRLKPGIQERQFENEVYHLMRLKHPNIVRFLGYCHETQHECLEHDGKYIFAEIQRQKLICLEYLPNGSLDTHLSDETSGHEWHTRYKIIQGICCGLHYLHEECQSQFSASVIHLDLKPGNILLDEYMEPKIADFGLSRLFEDNKTQTCATFLSGSFGYMAPEYLFGRIVTAKADIYNLGVIIIEIITGSKDNILSLSTPTSCQKFVDRVLNNWRNRLEGAPSETDCKQIRYCLEIGLDCIKHNREERPTSREIIERLDRWETTNCNVNNEKRPAADQILTHMEEKPSVSTTGYESTFCTVQPNITGVRSTEAEDNNSNTSTGAGPKPYRSLNRSRARGLLHRQMSRVLRFMMHQLSCVLITRQRSRPLSLSLEGVDYDVDYGCVAGRHPSSERDSHGTPLQRNRLLSDPTEEFTFAKMEAATNGFSLEAKIGEGSFGTVYRGYLPDGREVAIKRGKSGSHDDDRRLQESEFLSEVALLSRFRHKHLVDLVGYCVEKKERLLVCEYMKNGALYDHLHRPKATASSSSLVMSSWKLRISILLDASRGIEYLNSYAVPPIIHRDIKSSNILLDASWRARVSGFGMSLKESEARIHRRTVVKALGTVGYMDPEYYYGQHHLTVKSDVYGFGVVMLEVLTGKPAIFKEAESGSPLSVVDYAVPSVVSGELGKVLDPRVPEPAAHEVEAVELVAYTAVHCVRLVGKDRPAMADIIANLATAVSLCESKDGYDSDLVKRLSTDSLPMSLMDQD